MGVLSSKELSFLKSHELCRLATASKDAKPHVVPVIYALDGDDIVIAIDYGTKKLENLRQNNRVALVVDDYRPNHAVMVEGECSILEKGKEYLRLLQVLFDRFEVYRRHPWGEGESPILKVRPTKAVMW
ncbi:MAG TPA: pyridoxamine 5'-phosphate oxidase family protein [Nitrososphaerales archaeon]|nr:pyridoxamine 5'-phosphate oxidase family protein [Nitrososphaerales archaeon]HUK79053.1 pyridoxamine 5'-phosphate oxidase family protein [Nitrososphaerales archaeon]